jgi:hypothetical protein
MTKRRTPTQATTHPKEAEAPAPRPKAVRPRATKAVAATATKTPAATSVVKPAAKTAKVAKAPNVPKAPNGPNAPKAPNTTKKSAEQTAAPRMPRARKTATALPPVADLTHKRDVSAPLTEEQLRHMAEARHRAIAEAAYLLAERRGFVPGMELHDWLTAEAEYNIRAEAS